MLHRKKTETLFCLCHHSENSFSDSLIYHFGFIKGLPKFFCGFFYCKEPIHWYSTVEGSILILFPNASSSIDFTIVATISGFENLLLKIISFRASHIFHHMNFGIAFQILLHLGLIEPILGYMDFSCLLRKKIIFFRYHDF